MRWIAIFAIGLATSVVNKSLHIGYGDWQSWAYLGLMLAFSFATDSRHNRRIEEQ